MLTTVSSSETRPSTETISSDSPSARPVRRPSNTRDPPASTIRNRSVTSPPAALNRTRSGSTDAGGSTRTSAVPPVTVSGREDSTDTDDF